MITLVLATNNKNSIGLNDAIPWPKNSIDLQNFKDMTMGKTLYAGRKTIEGLPKLPGRELKVISRDKGADVTDLDKFLNEHANNSSTDIYIIGGAQIYNIALDFADTVFITKIDDDTEGDVFLRNDDWEAQYDLQAYTRLDDITGVYTYHRKYY